MGGCLSRKTGEFDPQKGLADLTGKVVIVTGANTGIGYHTVKFLARKGAKVYLGARNETKAKAAIVALEKEGLGSGQVVWLRVDFSDPRWAKRAAEEFLAKETRLDILINNAAQLTGTYAKTKDGRDQLTYGRQSFQPFCVYSDITSIAHTDFKGSGLRRQNYYRSMAHGQGRALAPNIKFSSIDDFNEEFASDFYPDWSRYCITKLACVLIARQLQKKFDDANIPILSIPIHPGEINTFADRTPWPFLANIAMELFFMRPEPGSYTSCFAAASPLVRNFPNKYKHAYLEPVGHIGELSENAKRDELASQLWQTTQRIINDLDIDIPVF